MIQLNPLETLLQILHESMLFKKASNKSGKPLIPLY
jgi:hypothetical protein